jgi:hypothetical protein
MKKGVLVQNCDESHDFCSICTVLSMLATDRQHYGLLVQWSDVGASLTSMVHYKNGGGRV